jgi:hypothetical protein
MSVLRTVANTERGSQFYVNTDTITYADCFDANGTALASGGATNSLAVGLCLVRDMGKTLRLPNNTLSSTTSNTKYRLLRKVQFVDVSSMDLLTVSNGNQEGVINTSGATHKLLAGGTFYIEISPARVAGTGVRMPWARVTVPN